MKKLFLLIAAATISTAMYAQSSGDKPAETTPATPATDAGVTIQPATDADQQTAVQAAASHSDYAMVDGKLIHCMGDKKMPVTRDVTLRNGAVLSAKGEVKTRDGKVTTLKNGQCIDLTGKIGTLEEMHPDMKKETPAQKAK